MARKNKTATGRRTRGRLRYRKRKVTGNRSYPVTIWNKKGHRANAPVTRVSLTMQSLAGFMPPQAEVRRDNNILRCPVSRIACLALPRTYLLSVSKA